MKGGVKEERKRQRGKEKRKLKGRRMYKV